jgi:hypothetical protein
LREEFPELVVYHYRKDADCFMLNNESAFKTFNGEVCLPIKKGAVYYDAMKNDLYQMSTMDQGDKKIISIELAPYGSCIIFDSEGDDLPYYHTLTEQFSQCNNTRNLSEVWNYSLATAKEYPKFSDHAVLETLLPISRIHPNFSGYICYEKQIEVSKASDPMYLKFEFVAEVMELWINDIFVGKILHPPYVFNVSNFMINGKNRIKAIVTTTLDRDQNNYTEPYIILNHDISEGTGMYGEVVLYYNL